jgi:hypothetical protein
LKAVNYTQLILGFGKLFYTSLQCQLFLPGSALACYKNEAVLIRGETTGCGANWYLKDSASAGKKRNSKIGCRICIWEIFRIPLSSHLGQARSLLKQ